MIPDEDSLKYAYDCMFLDPEEMPPAKNYDWYDPAEEDNWHTEAE